MKKSSGFLNFLLSYLAILLNLGYLFIEPLIFSTVGLIYQVPWQYYLITIGGFYALMVVWELVAHLALKNSDRKFHCPFVRKLKKIISRFTAESEYPQKAENVENLPTEDN